MDDYEILHSISVSLETIEEELDRLLTIDEKKQIAHDNYSVIQEVSRKKYNHTKGNLPITASVLELVETTQDKNLFENITQVETDLGRSLTKQEMIMVAKGDITGLEKTFHKPLSTDKIKSIYRNRFLDLENELNRNLTDQEIRDMLSGKLSGIENALGRQLVIVYFQLNVSE